MASERVRFAQNETLATTFRSMHACEHTQSHLIAVDNGDGVCWCPWCGAIATREGWRRPVPLRLLDDGTPGGK